MRALAALGVVAEETDGRISLTPLGTPLRSDVPGSMRNLVLFRVGEWYWRSWGDLLHSVRTGEPAFDRVFGMSNFEYLERPPEAGAIHDWDDARAAAILRRCRAPSKPPDTRHSADG